jgi:hypothetical protein
MVLAGAIAIAGLGAATPAMAAAALPDGRVYERVSAEKRNGNLAGVHPRANGKLFAPYAAATSSAIAYWGGGPQGETSSGTDNFSVSRRNANKGWETGAALPPEAVPNADYLGAGPLVLLASADLSHFAFVATGPYVKENYIPPGLSDTDLGLYRTRGNSSEPEWLTRPTFAKFSEAKPEPTTIEIEGVYPVGGSADLSTAYFTYFGTLVPADKSRAPHVEPLEYLPWNPTTEYASGVIIEETNGEAFRSRENANIGHKPVPSETTEWWTPVSLTTGTEGPWGFYEWHEGQLRSAGELPGGAPPSPFGAVPAVTGAITGSGQTRPFARFLQNEVSQDGSRAFFVSPQPQHAAEAKAPTELYVREQTPGGPKTVLVSRDEGNAPAPAPGCASTPNFSTCAETAVTPVNTRWVSRTYVYASPDGSRAFFESKDKLTSSAPEGAEPKTYQFNVASEKVTYLPGVVGPIAASSQDGSSFIFMNTGTKKIELWTGGPAPVEIASFSTPAGPEFEGSAPNDAARPGAAFVFNTNAVLKHGTQEFNNSAGVLQAYRYEPSSNKLECLSCAPQGMPQRAIEEGHESGSTPHPREIADEGARVFFATPTKLVPQAENEVENVYEWEQAGTGSCPKEPEGGCVYLLSSGASHDQSFYLESDESGENVFFATTSALVKSDTDESYDVYDARVKGGFPEEAPPAGCESSCRFAGAAPSLATPLSTALGPAENTNRVESSGVPSSPKPKPLTRAQKLASALKACAKKPKRQRAACIKRAGKLYGAKAKAKRNTGSGGRRR